MQRFSRQSPVNWKFSRDPFALTDWTSATRRPQNENCVTVHLDGSVATEFPVRVATEFPVRQDESPPFNGTALHFAFNRSFDCAVLDRAPRDPVERLPVDADAAVGSLAYTPDEVETRDLRHRRPRS